MTDRAASFAILAALACGALLPRAASGAPPCDEPSDPDYTAAMVRVRDAIGRGDYASVLAELEQQNESHDAAVLEYGVARAFHHLGRLDEAIAAYTRFLSRFESCPDPEDLARTARDFRSLAIQEQLQSQPAPPVAAAAEPPAESPAEPPAELPAASPAASPAEPLAEREPAPAEPQDDVPWLGWTLTALGVALVGSGVAYDLANQDVITRLDESRLDNDADGYDAAADDVRSGRVVDGILYGTGIVALASGLVLVILDAVEATPVSPELGLGPSGPELGLVVRF